jgi:two-component system response regulator FixJ
MSFSAESPVVHVVDDEPGVRESLVELLRSIGLEVHAHSSGEEFLADYDPSTPGCLLVDICMPGMSGLELHSQLVERGIGLPWIVLTGHADVAMAVEAMGMGACGFLEKPYRSHELLQLIKQAVEQGKKSYHTQLRRREVMTRFARLSPRELEVMNLVTEGAANKQIATRLGISERTVEVHRSRVMKKLSADTLVELLSLGIEYRAIQERETR